jgi:hypothetical protein
LLTVGDSVWDAGDSIFLGKGKISRRPSSLKQPHIDVQNNTPIVHYIPLPKKSLFNSFRSNGTQAAQLHHRQQEQASRSPSNPRPHRRGPFQPICGLA